MHRKKALFKYEMRTMIWFLFAGLFAVMLLIGFMENNMADMFCFPNWTSERGTEFGLCLSNSLVKGIVIAIPSLAFMTIVQFSEFHRRKTQEYFHSLPFRKGERYLMKVFVGGGILTITSFAAAVGVLIVRARYIDDIQKVNALHPYYRIVMGNDTVWHAVLQMIHLWLVLLAIYSVMVLAHAMVNQGILASLIGMGITVAPYWAWTMIGHYMYRADASEQVQESWYKLKSYFALLVGDGFNEMHMVADDTDGIFPLLCYPNFWIVFLLCLAVIAACVAVSCLLVKHADMAKGSILVQNAASRNFLSLGIAICVGAAIGTYFVYHEVSLAGEIALAIAFATALFVIMRKVFRLSFR